MECLVVLKPWASRTSPALKPTTIEDGLGTKLSSRILPYDEYLWSWRTGPR